MTVRGWLTPLGIAYVDSRGKASGQVVIESGVESWLIPVGGITESGSTGTRPRACRSRAHCSVYMYYSICVNTDDGGAP